jgi:hypothetical protein
VPAPEQSIAAEEATPAEASPPRTRAERRAAARAARAERRREIAAASATPDDTLTTAADASASIAFSAPRGSVVFVNGARRGTVPALSALQLAPGDYHIEIRRGRARPYVSDVNLQPGDHLHIQYRSR